MFRRALPVFVLLLSYGSITFSGCVAHAPKPLKPEITHRQLEDRRLTSGEIDQILATQGLPPGGDWDLTRLTFAALHYSPELDVARAQLREAEAAVQTASALPNPTFSFSPAYNDTSPGTTPLILGYALDLPIETAGKRGYRTAEARHRAASARLLLASRAWAVRSAVRRGLTDLQAAEAMADLWRSQRPLLADAARLVGAQVEAGDASPLFAAQARIALNRAELSARESDRAVAIARSRLAEAIGVPLTALEEVKLSYRGLTDLPEAATPVVLRSFAAQNRADLLAELAAYAAADSALQIEIARQYPDLSIRPGYQLDQGQGKWSLGVGVSIPVFHRNQGPIKTAETRREVAAARFLALQNRVLAEVDRASADYASAVGDMENVKAMRASLEQQTRTVAVLQQAGETSRLELVRAQIELADNTRAELEASVRLARALSALEDAVQRPIGWSESTLRKTESARSN